MEESSAQRQLDSISRHLLLQPSQPNHGLQQAMLLSNGKSESEGSETVVIGGMALDIHATPSILSNPRTTTPGKVECEGRNGYFGVREPDISAVLVAAQISKIPPDYERCCPSPSSSSPTRPKPQVRSSKS
ncbi:hypothetical protein EV1_040116 [Malus domestica]